MTLVQDIAAADDVGSQDSEWMPTPGGGPAAGAGEAPITPRMVEIIRILQGNLLLTEPCLKWLQQKQAELSMASLRVLYTDEEIKAKIAAMQEAGS